METPPPPVAESTPAPPPPSTPQPTETPQTHLQDPPPPSSTEPTTTTTSTPPPTPSLPSTSLPFPQPRAAFSRPWQQPPQSTAGMAIGVPAHHPPPPSSAFNTPPFGYPRNLTDSLPTSQVRQPTQGMGITGSLGAVRPTGVPGNQLRPMQPPVGPPSGINMQPPTSQVGARSKLAVSSF